MIREPDAHFIVDAISSGDCASVVGLSNMGKSALLRELCTPAAQAFLLGDRSDDWLFAYVDCNLMPERSEQALHEATLRSTLSAFRRVGAGDGLLHRLDVLYQHVVQPAAPIRGPLAFNEAIREVCEGSGRRLTLIFDEFDDPFETLAGRVYLNLRALKDQYRNELTYVTATERPLSHIRQDGEASEFVELFDTRERWIGLLSEADACALATELTADAGATQADIDHFVREAGGHSGLLEAVTEEWKRFAAGTAESARQEAWALVREALDGHPRVRAECAKIWAQLNDAERQAFIAHEDDGQADENVLRELRAKRLLDRTGNGGEVAVGELWQAFVRHQHTAQPDARRGVTVDVDSGEVYVDGHTIETLTELEYKLLLLLYGRLNKVVDKYSIVTNVWGETYLDSVDDARIEKLVSRLRNKLEPDAAEPRYLTTLRGRGYRLVG
jgi:hypothetical protein